MPRWISPEAVEEEFVDGCSAAGSEDAGSVACSDGTGADGSDGVEAAGSVAGSDDAGAGGSVAASDGTGVDGSDGTGIAGSDGVEAAGSVAGSEGIGIGGSVASSEDAGAGGSVTGSDCTGDADSAVGSEDAGADGPACGSDAVEAAASAAGSVGSAPESPPAESFDAETAVFVAEVPVPIEAVSAACKEESCVIFDSSAACTFRFSQPFMEFPPVPCISRTASIAASTFLPLRFFIFSIVLSCQSDICNPLCHLPDSVKTPPSIS